MDKKLIAIIVVIIAVVACVAVFASGFLSLGNEEVINETYNFNKFTLDLPQNATMSNSSNTTMGVYFNTYIVSWTYKNGTSESMNVTYVEGDNATNQQYVKLWTSLGAIDGGTYGDWVIIIVPKNTTHNWYTLAKYDDGVRYELRGHNLGVLKKAADTFKKV